MLGSEYTGARLRELRKRAHLTQMQVVEATGVSEATLCYLEKGQRKPQVNTLRKLLHLYAEKIQYWNRIGKILEESPDAQGKIDTEAPEWRRSSGQLMPSDSPAPRKSRPLP